MGQFWKSETFQKKKSPCLQLFKSKTKEVKQSRERVNRFIFASSVYTLFYTLSYLFSLWWNEQTTAAAAAAAGSRHNIFNNDTISSFYTSFASHIANKTATAWNTTTTTKKKKVLVQENMRFRAQRWEDIGLDSCSNIFPGPPLFSSSSSSSSSSTLGCSRRQSRLTP